MPYCKKIVLHTPKGLPSGIDSLAEQFIKDGVMLVAAVGRDCTAVEESIDWVDVMNSLREETVDYRFILTSSHPDASLEDVIAFAESLSGEFAGDVQVLEV